MKRTRGIKSCTVRHVEGALSHSYGAELRSERGGRSATLFDHDHQHYQDTTEAAALTLPFPLHLDKADNQWCYDASIARWRRRLASIAWPLRKAAGKCWSILRLVKALFTFEGGLDYIVWKLERHSGQAVELSPRARRWPLLFIWGDMWRLYRRSVFR